MSCYFLFSDVLSVELACPRSPLNPLGYLIEKEILLLSYLRNPLASVYGTVLFNQSFRNLKPLVESTLCVG